MYFASRLQAGRMLASQISAKYAGQDCVVVALSDGGVVVGSQIALSLHAPLCLLLSDEIQLPRELTALAGITQDGSFSYNHAYSDGEIDEMVSEYRGAIEAQKLEKLHHLHRSSGGGELIRDDMLDGRNIILVSDGLTSGFALDLAMVYLKPINFKSVIMAAPMASVQAVDRMHILASDLFCLNVLEDFISVAHYYDTQDVPKHELVLKTVARIVADWKAGDKNPDEPEVAALLEGATESPAEPAEPAPQAPVEEKAEADDAPPKNTEPPISKSKPKIKSKLNKTKLDITWKISRVRNPFRRRLLRHQRNATEDSRADDSNRPV